MADVNVTVFIESPHVKSFLFQCSKYWASEGSRVCYVSHTQQSTLPALVQGAGSDADLYTEFMNISFITASSVHGLMEFLINLQKSPHIPKVLVVEDVTSYVSTSDSAEPSFLLLCALLKHISQTCWKFHKSTIFLILSMQFIPEKLNALNLILNPCKIWKTVPSSDETSNVSNFSLQEISTNPLSDTSQTLEFSLIEQPTEKFLRLNNIKDLFGESCNFNNKIF